MKIKHILIATIMVVATVTATIPAFADDVGISLNVGHSDYRHHHYNNRRHHRDYAVRCRYDHHGYKRCHREYYRRHHNY